MTTESTAVRPQPLNSLIASARRLTEKSLVTRAGSTRKGWQDDAWDMFDLVGELRFLAVTLAGRMSQAKLYVGELADDPTEAPEPTEDPALTSILDSIGASAAARAQLIARLGINLFLPGDGWLAGIPRHLFPPTLLVGPLDDPSMKEMDLGLLEELSAPVDGTLDITNLEWRMLSINEVSANVGGDVQLILGETEAERIITSPDNLFMIRVWRPHPRKWWEADSPTRSSLPVLRELVGLTMKTSAEIDSRLAGAGMLIVPQSAQRALQIAAGIPEAEATDMFTEALMEAMLTPIGDRANASAVVPLVVTVPDEATDRFKFLDFGKPLDQFAGERLDKTIRRLALGLDAPPELLLGTGGMNHWGAWLVLEDVVTTHLEPPLALICDALTTQFLWPVLISQGMLEEAARRYVIWYDVSDLVVRPTRGADSHTLHEAGVINDASYRAANGFDDADAPTHETTQPPEVMLALDLISKAPALMGNPGLPQLVAQIRAVLTGDIPEVLDPAAAVRSAEEKSVGQIPVAADDQDQPPVVAKPGSPGSAAPSLPAQGPQPASPPPASQSASGLLLPGLLVETTR